MKDQHTLDCQDCGNVLRVLTPAEAQKVAANPYNYIAYCKRCASAIESEIHHNA